MSDHLHSRPTWCLLDGLGESADGEGKRTRDMLELLARLVDNPGPRGQTHNGLCGRGIGGARNGDLMVYPDASMLTSICLLTTYRGGRESLLLIIHPGEPPCSG